MVNKMIEKWKKGRKQTQLLYSLPISFGLNLLSTILGIVISLLIILPIVLLVYQTIEIYGYILLANKILLVISLILLCIAFMFLNALITLFTTIILKSNLKDIPNAQEIDLPSLFLYQFLNPGFIIFIFIVVMIFGGSF